MNIATLRRHIRSLGSAERADFCQRYFKTGRGEYAEGDRFLGLDAPAMHALSKQYREAPLDVVEKLLQSPFHEERCVALLILVRKFERGERDAVLALYLGNTAYINNWDLVDCSARDIVGARDMTLLRRLAKSKSLWERRIAIIATHEATQRGDFAPTLEIAAMLLGDAHDLIHKAAGWMLREVGKRDLATAKRFLDEHAATMPRAMLRYAIERFPDRERKRYLNATSG
jgi:3-methyladenine DNA glycosylase AlkD